MNKLLVIVVMLISGFAFSAEPTHYLCKLKGSVRTIRILKDKEGCITTYTREGVEKVVANGKYYGHCTRVIENIKKNLEAADWKCKDISQSGVSSNRELEVGEFLDD